MLGYQQGLCKTPKGPEGGNQDEMEIQGKEIEKNWRWKKKTTQNLHFYSCKCISLIGTWNSLAYFDRIISSLSILKRCVTV